MTVTLPLPLTLPLTVTLTVTVTVTLTLVEVGYERSAAGIGRMGAVLARGVHAFGSRLRVQVPEEKVQKWSTLIGLRG